MHLSPIEVSLNMQLTSPPMEADLHTYGFPPGYFIIKNVATDKLLDVESDMVEDGTPLILFPGTESSLVEGASLYLRFLCSSLRIAGCRYEKARV